MQRRSSLHRPGQLTADDLPFEMPVNDPFDLQRFVDAQDRAGLFAHVLAELRDGRKTSHWMWFVFPQVAGLGMSAISQRYAIGSLDEARAYAAHPVLGTRLRECISILNALPSSDARAIFGEIDAMKLRSSLTLFIRAVPGDTIFAEALRRYFGGALDPATEARL